MKSGQEVRGLSLCQGLIGLKYLLHFEAPRLLLERELDPPQEKQCPPQIGTYHVLGPSTHITWNIGSNPDIRHISGSQKRNPALTQLFCPRPQNG